jgi:hypothetical protein
MFTVLPSQHCGQRQTERGISMRELQGAIKYGQSYETASGRMVYAHNDIMHITDDTTRHGITCYRLKPDEPAPTAVPNFVCISTRAGGKGANGKR